MRDERDPLVAEGAGGRLAGQLGQVVEFDRLGGYDALVGDQRGRGERLPVLPPGPG
jgi:hypothetical protein